MSGREVNKKIDSSATSSKEPSAQPSVNVVVNNNVPTVAVGAVQRNHIVALLLSIFLGMFGIDRFYLASPGLGIVKLFTFGLFGILWIIDIIMIATKSVKGIAWDDDVNDGGTKKPSEPWSKKKKMIVFGAIGALLIIGVVGASAGGDEESTDRPVQQTSSESSKAEDKKSKERLTLDKGWKVDDSNPYMTYVVGTVFNNSDKPIKGYVQITFSAYDSDGANVGDCLDNANTVDANGKWKFKAICSGDDIEEVKFKAITGF